MEFRSKIMPDGKNNEYPRAEFAKLANVISQTSIELLHQFYLESSENIIGADPTPELLLNQMV